MHTRQSTLQRSAYRLCKATENSHVNFPMYRCPRRRPCEEVGEDTSGAPPRHVPDGLRPRDGWRRRRLPDSSGATNRRPRGYMCFTWLPCGHAPAHCQCRSVADTLHHPTCSAWESQPGAPRQSRILNVVCMRFGSKTRPRRSSCAQTIFSRAPLPRLPSTQAVRTHSRRCGRLG